MEFCLNVKPVMQPYPNKNPNGDCFACALTAIISHLFPEKEVEFNKIWDCFLVNYKDSEKKGLSNTWPGMLKAIVEVYRDGYDIEYRKDIIIPEYNLNFSGHAWWSFAPAPEYSIRLEAWLKAGWIALSEINMHGIDTDKSRHAINHFVVVDGIKAIWEPIDGVDGRSLNYYTHVVCSVKGAYWIKTSEFLTRHGASAWILIRKNLR